MQVLRLPVRLSFKVSWCWSTIVAKNVGENHLTCLSIKKKKLRDIDNVMWSLYFKITYQSIQFFRFKQSEGTLIFCQMYFYSENIYIGTDWQIYAKYYCKAWNIHLFACCIKKKMMLISMEVVHQTII